MIVFCLCACMCVCMFVSVCIYVCIIVRDDMLFCEIGEEKRGVRRCVESNACTHTHTHTYTHTHTHMYLSLQVNPTDKGWIRRVVGQYISGEKFPSSTSVPKSMLQTERDKMKPDYNPPDAHTH